jgi:hypothetical protein
MKLAVIIRILGNENPPRDIPGERVKVLKHILENEPQPPEVVRFFILNRIVSDEYRKELQTLLESYQLPVVIIPFNWRIKTTVESVAIHGIAINHARNVAIACGANVARYTIVLDGDCGYLSIPHRRDGQERQGEPMLAFRNDSELRFDELLAFGQKDKLELLFQLGHDPTPYSGHLKIEGDQTKLVGEVIHYATGEPEIEADNKAREAARRASLQGLARQIVKQKAERLQEQRRLRYEIVRREWEKKTTGSSIQRFDGHGKLDTVTMICSCGLPQCSSFRDEGGSPCKYL